jgi:anti-sigma factor RsiW
MVPELDPDTDLCWLALRYVSGELDRDQAEAFERRLDQDQAAREAVAEAVALAGAIAALPPAGPSILPMPKARRPFRAVVAILGLAAAACLAWLFAGPHGPPAPSPAPEDEVAAGAIKPSASVTLAWSKLQQEGAGEDVEANELLAWNGAVPGTPEAEVASTAESEEASDHGLPLWLLDAASLAGRPDALAAPVKEH